MRIGRRGFLSAAVAFGAAPFVLRRARAQGDYPNRPVRFIVPLAAGYLAWNLLSFGHAVPISGALKSSFPTITFSPSRLAEPHTLFGTLQILVSGLGLLWLWARPRPSWAKLSRSRS